MFDPTAMIMADKATRHHVLSTRPKAPRTPERPPRQRGGSGVCGRVLPGFYPGRRARYV